MGSVVGLGLLGLALLLGAAAIAGWSLGRGGGPDEIAPTPTGIPLLDDDVVFTVYQPDRALAGADNPLIFFAHRGRADPSAPEGTPDPWDLVEDQAAAALGSRSSPAPEALGVPPLMVVPAVDGGRFVPSRAALGVEATLQRLDFRFVPAEGAHASEGVLRVVLFGGLVLAELPISVPVGAEPVDGLVPLPSVRPARPDLRPPARRAGSTVGWLGLVGLAALAGAVVGYLAGASGSSPQPPDPVTARVRPLDPGLTIRLAGRAPEVASIEVTCADDHRAEAPVVMGLARIDTLPGGACEARLRRSDGSLLGSVPVARGSDLVCRPTVTGAPDCYEL